MGPLVNAQINQILTSKKVCFARTNDAAPWCLIQEQSQIDLVLFIQVQLSDPEMKQAHGTALDGRTGRCGFDPHM